MSNNQNNNWFNIFEKKLNSLKDMDDNELIGKDDNSLAYMFAKNSKMNINQLRKLFSMIKNLYEKNKNKNEIDKTDLIKLYPIVAYSKGRDLLKKEEADAIYLMFDKLKEDLSKESLEKFHSFFQAVIAYRKYLGG